MPTTVVIPPRVNIDVDEADAVSPFAAITPAPFDPPEWLDDGKLSVHFPTVDLTDAQVNAIINLAQVNPPAEAEPIEPVPPSTAPTPEVFQPGTKSLGIKWQAVENATPVDYDVYLSAAPGAYAPANLIGSTAASMAISNTLADGTPLEHGQTYYWQIQPRSGPAMGPVSAEVSGTLAQINSADIVAASIIADLLAVGAVNAQHLAAMIVIAGEIATAESGERSGISAVQGFFSNGPDGELIFQVFGGNAYFDGAVNARTLNVVEGATWSGSNVGSPGAETMMGNNLGAPANPPTVEPIWPEVTLDDGGIAGDAEAFRRGLVWTTSHWFVASQNAGTGQMVVLKFDSAGTFVASSSGVSDGPEGAPSSLTLHSGVLYMHQQGTSQVFKVDPADLSNDGNINLVGTSSSQKETGVLGSNGTNLVLASVGFDLRVVQAYNTSGAQVGSSAILDNQGLNPVSVLGGSFDLGSTRLLVSGPQNVCSFATSGSPRAENLTHRFQSPDSLGVCWTGTEFASLTNGGLTVRTHTDALKDEPETSTVDRWPGHSWYDSDLIGGPHETKCGAMAKRTFTKRARHRITTTARVPSGGGTDDPNGARFYIGESALTSLAELHGTDTPGTGQYASIEIDGVTTPTLPTNPPPGSGNFPQGSPYRHFSEAVDGGGDPLTEMDGAGNFWAKKGVAGQVGVQVCTVLAIDTTYDVLVNFDVPFASVPAVFLTRQSDGTPHQATYTAGNITTTGFRIYYRRSQGTANIDVAWHAMPKTQ